MSWPFIKEMYRLQPKDLQAAVFSDTDYSRKCSKYCLDRTANMHICLIKNNLTYKCRVIEALEIHTKPKKTLKFTFSRIRLISG